MPKKRTAAGRTRRPTTPAPGPQPPSPPPAPGYTTDELKYVARYPGRRFVPGTLSPPGATTVFGAKRAITIICEACGAERVIATSDIFHCRFCVACAAAAKRSALKVRSPGGVA